MLIYLKLGGSLVTDKTQSETIRPDVLANVAQQIATARATTPNLQLLLGHGSGSFGHVVAAKYGTRQGIHSAEQWRGFAEVSAAARRLNTIVCDALMAADVPVISLQPHASAEVSDGTVTHIASAPVAAALSADLVPIVMGDVAFDDVRGGTILSTEEVMTALATPLPPAWLLLAGETDGVYDTDGNTIPLITRGNLDAIRTALGGSRGTDVTGGMLSKVLGMLTLVEQRPSMKIRIFSGLPPNNIANTLRDPANASGTVIAV